MTLTYRVRSSFSHAQVCDYIHSLNAQKPVLCREEIPIFPEVLHQCHEPFVKAYHWVAQCLPQQNNENQMCKLSLYQYAESLCDDSNRDMSTSANNQVKLFSQPMNSRFPKLCLTMFWLCREPAAEKVHYQLYDVKYKKSINSITHSRTLSFLEYKNYRQQESGIRYHSKIMEPTQKKKFQLPSSNFIWPLPNKPGPVKSAISVQIED